MPQYVHCNDLGFSLVTFGFHVRAQRACTNCVTVFLNLDEMYEILKRFILS